MLPYKIRLNDKFREDAWNKIDAENNHIHNFINGAKSSYDVKGLEQKYLKNREIYHFLSSRTTDTVLHLGLLDKAKEEFARKHAHKQRSFKKISRNRSRSIITEHKDKSPSDVVRDITVENKNEDLMSPPSPLAHSLKTQRYIQYVNSPPAVNPKLLPLYKECYKNQISSNRPHSHESYLSAAEFEYIHTNEPSIDTSQEGSYAMKRLSSMRKNVSFSMMDASATPKPILSDRLQSITGEDLEESSVEPKKTFSAFLDDKFGDDDYLSKFMSTPSDVGRRNDDELDLPEELALLYHEIEDNHHQLVEHGIIARNSTNPIVDNVQPTNEYVDHDWLDELDLKLDLSELDSLPLVDNKTPSPMMRLMSFTRQSLSRGSSSKPHPDIPTTPTFSRQVTATTLPAGVKVERRWQCVNLDRTSSIWHNIAIERFREEMHADKRNLRILTRQCVLCQCPMTPVVLINLESTCAEIEELSMGRISKFMLNIIDVGFYLPGAHKIQQVDDSATIISPGEKEREIALKFTLSTSLGVIVEALPILNPLPEDFDAPVDYNDEEIQEALYCYEFLSVERLQKMSTMKGCEELLPLLTEMVQYPIDYLDGSVDYQNTLEKISSSNNFSSPLLTSSLGQASFRLPSKKRFTSREDLNNPKVMYSSLGSVLDEDAEVVLLDMIYDNCRISYNAETFQCKLEMSLG